MCVWGGGTAPSDEMLAWIFPTTEAMISFSENCTAMLYPRIAEYAMTTNPSSTDAPMTVNPMHVTPACSGCSGCFDCALRDLA